MKEKLDVQDLKKKIIRHIIRWENEEDAFNELAIEIFWFQYENNEPYKTFCQNQGITRASKISSYKDIPPVPQRAFKYYELVTEPTENAKYLFLSSGTTEEVRSWHFIFYPELYEKSFAYAFKHFVLPDRDRMRFIIAFPPFEYFEHSSLSYMFKGLKELFGDIKSEYVTGKNLKVDFGKVIRILKEAEVKGEEVAILGTSLAILWVVNRLRKKRIKFELKKGSRIMDTGGYKGKIVRIKPEDLYEMCEEFLSIPRSYIVNEYGMSEMNSQYYDRNLRDVFENRKPEYVKTGVPWTRFRIVDPETLEDSEYGVLIHYDLCNLTSCISILTEDYAEKKDNGFVLLGRRDDYDLRGCSLITEDIDYEQ